VLQALGSKLEVDEDLAGTSRVLPLRPSASVWDVLAGGWAGEERQVSGGGTRAHTHTHTHSDRYSKRNGAILRLLSFDKLWLNSCHMEIKGTEKVSWRSRKSEFVYFFDCKHSV